MLEAKTLTTVVLQTLTVQAFLDLLRGPQLSIPRLVVVVVHPLLQVLINTITLLLPATLTTPIILRVLLLSRLLILVPRPIPVELRYHLRLPLLPV